MTTQKNEHRTYAMLLKNGVALDLDLTVPRRSAVNPYVSERLYKGTMYEWAKLPLKQLAEYAAMLVKAEGDDAYRRDIKEYAMLCQLADGLLSDEPYVFPNTCKTLEGKLKEARAEYQTGKAT